MLDNYGIRTDLALEATERFTEENVEVRGVEIHEDYNEEKDIRTTVVKITTENGARTMGRPQGSYITIEAPGLSVHDEDYHREISLEIARHLQNVINLERELSILVVGLGNSAITADSLGPHVVENLHITRREFDSWISEKSTCRSHKTCFFCVKFLVFIYCILLQCVVRYNKGGILHASYYIEI